MGDDDRVKGQQYGEIFACIDKVEARIEAFQTPSYPKAVRDRSNPAPWLEKSDRDMLKCWVVLIAYSNNARASAVDRLMKSGTLDTVFCDYDAQAVAQLDLERVLHAYWPQIKSIRFKYKVERIIGCAQALLAFQLQHGSFQRYLETLNMPMLVRCEADFERFWQGFDVIWADFRRLRVPHLKNQTTLCHMFLELDYDCAKPDVAVMKAAVQLGIIPPSTRKNGSFPDRRCRHVVQLMQRYAMCQGIRVPLVDLYFLIHGGQTGAQEYVRDEYYA